MRAIMIMYDTLCRNFLQPYGNDWVKTPNFQRLAEKSVTFDSNYVCSLPCMPARRDLHNSRVNFLQRDWGPLEPFDDSMPEILKQNGIYSALISDHYHYWEDGGCTYHNRYNSWIAHRGQEGDFCVGDRTMVELVNRLGKTVADPQVNASVAHVQDQVNRSYQLSEMDMPQAKTFADGLKFLQSNAYTQNWFLQIETFDPHEPFFTQPRWKELYPELANYIGSKTDWPGYDPVRPHETPEDVSYVRNLYAAIVSMCDHYLGTILDFMDAHDMWKDTMLIVNTDHGFLLGEHDWWGKSIMPAYEEISHTPLFVYDPVSGIQGQRRNGLTSAIDLPVTVLDFFGLEIPKDMQGYSLLPLIREDQSHRKTALFGFHAGHVAITDGRYTYFRAPLAQQEKNCYDYTLMPTRMRRMYTVDDLRKAEFVEPLPNSKGCWVLKTPAHGSYVSPVNFGTKLYDVHADPKQASPVDDPVLEAKLASLLVLEMKKAGAPAEQFERLGLPHSEAVTAEMILAGRSADALYQTPDYLPNVQWSQEAKNIWRAWSRMMPKQALEAAAGIICQLHSNHADQPVSLDDVIETAKLLLPADQQQQVLYFMLMISRTV